MKKALLALSLIAAHAVNVQAQKSYKRPSALGFSFGFQDFKTAQALKGSSLSEVLDNKQWSKLRDMDAAIGIHFFKGLTEKLDLSVSLVNAFVKYPLPNRQNSGGAKYLGELDASANLKLLSDKYLFTPYLSAGVGGSTYDGYWGGIVPLGGGVKFNLLEEMALFSNFQYRLGISEATANHFYYNLGVAGRIGKKEEPAPVMAPPPPPPPPAPVDTDGDGIYDPADKCPTVAGVAKYDGCPIPDTDGDGINDELDKCPSVAGLAKYNGCPIPDTDGDGINDEEDRCITTPGVVANFGCPIPEFDNKNVQFEVSSAKLLPTGKDELNKLATYMTQFPSLRIQIDGHTDASGNPASNLKLSKSRAAAVEQYLVSKGVSEDRIETEGYGQTKPIADNKTKAGKAQNRRVEFSILK